MHLAMKEDPDLLLKRSPSFSPGISSASKADQSLDTPALASTALRMSYRIARGEQGVLTFEPYKSAILPLWRFKTPAIATKSSEDLWKRFVQYGEAGDFVGQDMTRKFIQMGMTRAKRYANHKGGKKYEKADANGVKKELPKSTGHKDKEEKEEASRIFRGYWERCKEDETYTRLKEEFLKEQKEWDKDVKRASSGSALADTKEKLKPVAKRTASRR